MSAPQITVLITAYNYGPFIEQAIDSVLEQDFPAEKREIVVVDDGSTDDTGERVKKYGSRVEYFYKTNGGQASALNFGFSKARGEILCLMDADDIFLPGKLRRVAEAFERNAGLGLVYHRLQEWHVSTDERRSWEFVEVSGDLRKEPEKFALYMAQPTSAVSFRRSVVEQLLPIPEEIRMLADCYLVALIPFLAPVLAIPEYLTVYRIHGKNSYTSAENEIPIETRRNKLKMWQTVTEAMRKWLAEHGYNGKQRGAKAATDRWKIIVEREEFAVTAPGRVCFFRHLLQCYRYGYPLMSWKLRAINLSNAVGALFVGYKHFHRLDEGREGVTRWARGRWVREGWEHLGERQPPVSDTGEITILAMPKPFRGHVGVIQRNAIASWTKLQPRPEVILFGHEEGAAECARELGLVHIPEVARNRYGTPLLAGIIAEGERRASHEVMAYVNADIILPAEFLAGVEKVRQTFPKFLAVGRRTNLEVREPLDFRDGWPERLKERVRREGSLESHTAIDCFVFPLGTYEDVPALAIGRVWFDQWLIKYARRKGLPVIDLTNFVDMVHQIHDYGHVAGGREWVYGGAEAEENLEYYGERPHTYTILSATHAMTRDGAIRRVFWRREAAEIKRVLWEVFVNKTLGVRKRLGLSGRQRV